MSVIFVCGAASEEKTESDGKIRAKHRQNDEGKIDKHTMIMLSCFCMCTAFSVMIYLSVCDILFNRVGEQISVALNTLVATTCALSKTEFSPFFIKIKHEGRKNANTKT